MTTPSRSPRRAPLRVGIALVLLLAVVLVIAGGAALRSDGQPKDAPTRPAEVAFAGDSMMREVAAALIAATEGPDVHSSFVLSATLADDPAAIQGWSTRAATKPPDQVVVLIGTWERATPGVAASLQQPSWPTPYIEAVRPFTDAITGAGGEVLWLGYPPMYWPDDPTGGVNVARLNQAYAAVGASVPGVTYLDAGAEVAGPDGSSVRSVVGEDGQEVVLRQLDQHLCPDGVVLVARPVVEELEQRLGITANSGWEQASWRHEPEHFQNPEQCPGLIPGT